MFVSESDSNYKYPVYIRIEKIYLKYGLNSQTYLFLFVCL